MKDSRDGLFGVRLLAWLAIFIVSPLGWTLLAQLPPVVFVSRQLGEAPEAAGRQRAVELAARGRLLIRATDGEIRPLVDATLLGPDGVAPVDVADPSVSYDGDRIVFAGYSSAEEAWRIFEIHADGTGLRQLTRSDRVVDLARFGEAAERLEGYDDLDPCYLPDGRICLVSSRSPGIAPDGRLRTLNLYVMDGDGGNLHRITSERFGADTPAVEPATGRVVYSRFWRTAPFQRGEAEEPPAPIVPGSPAYETIVVEPSPLPLRSVQEEEFPGVNSWFLAGINPDGTGLSMWSGFQLDREKTQAYRPSFLPNGEALAVFLPVTPFYGFPRGYGLRRFQQGFNAPVPLGGPQVFPRRNDLPPRVNFLYASAEPLADGRILVTATPAADATLDYGVYVQENAEAEPSLLYDNPSTKELDAIPLLERPVPPTIADVVLDTMSDEGRRSGAEAFELGGSFLFLCKNIYFNAPVDVPIPNAPPVGQPLAIEFYLNSQRSSPRGGDDPILLDRITLPPGGGIEATAPAGVPLFELLRRPDGTIGMGRDGQIFHVAGSNFGRAGDTALCVGCHVGHSQLEVPEDATYTNLAPSAVAHTSSERTHGRLNLQDFKGMNLVDRRTGAPNVEWAAGDANSQATIELRWTTTLRGREVVIYGTSKGDGVVGPRDQVISGLQVTTFLYGQEQESLDVTEGIGAEGTKVGLNSELDFDKLVIAIPPSSVTGQYEGQESVGLAEIEVIALATAGPMLALLLGDADCSQTVDFSDAMAILRFLFLAGPPSCCEAAADTDGSDSVNITDAIMILSSVMGTKPGLLSAECAPVPAARLSCDLLTCP